jgi:two-component system, NarL family, response regulator
VIRVLIADDHAMVRKAIAGLLATEPGIVIVGEVDDGEQAIAAFRQHRPDVTLMDLRMPHKGGVEAITEIRREFPDARFIVLTTYDDDADIHAALQAGARGYLLKEMTFEQLVEGVRTVHAGGDVVPAELALRAARHVPAFSTLSDRELEVLQLLAEGKTNQKIARALSISESTVKGHVNNILWKLGVDARTEAVVVAVKRGLVRIG